MKKYLCKVPLKYVNTVNSNRVDYSYDYCIEVKPVVLSSLNLELKKGDFIAKEKITINLLNSRDRILLEIDALYADNKNYAVDLLVELVENLLPALTYQFNKVNDNKHSTQYKLTYDLKESEVKEQSYKDYDDYLSNGSNHIYKDFLNISDSVAMKATQTINLDGYKETYRKYNENPLLKQIIKCYSRALGDTDYISKYFNLFIIIESLETHYKKEVEEKVVSDEDIEKFIKYLEKQEDEEISVISESEMIKNRIKGLLKNITKDPRGEKLQKILNHILEIKEIRVLGNSVAIDKAFVTKIIKHRNQLFHAKILTAEEQKKLKELVVQLFILSESIINKLINENQENLDVEVEGSLESSK